jgi:hypothetical protein
VKPRRAFARANSRPKLWYAPVSAWARPTCQGVRVSHLTPIVRISPKEAVSIEELLVSGFVQTDALAKLLIEKGIITQQEFLAKISEERATYQVMLKPTSH